MDANEARELLTEHGIDNVRLVVTDLMGMPRGKRVPVEKFLTACQQGRRGTLYGASQRPYGVTIPPLRHNDSNAMRAAQAALIGWWSMSSLVLQNRRHPGKRAAIGWTGRHVAS